MTAPAVAPSPEPSARELAAADRVGPYRLLRVIGEGTSGRVFEVEHERLGRRAAMKVLSPEQAAHPMMIDRFFREALAVNQINHRHIVEITDILERKKGAPADALVMELLEGRSLGQLVADRGRLPRERFLPIMADVCDALAAAHLAGFVHRDLKPDNIFLADRRGRADFVKLLDFGLAKRVAGESDGARLTLIGASSSGLFVGTPAYVSPEQASGGAVDRRTDIYSLGVILYEVATGRLPFTASNIGEFLLCHLNERPAHLPEPLRRDPIGRALDGIIQKCLEKDPAQRFDSASEIRELLRGLADGQAVEFTGMARYLAEQPVRGAARRRTIGAAIIGAAVLGGVGALLVHHRSSSGSTNAAGPSAAPIATREDPERLAARTEPAGSDIKRATTEGNDAPAPSPPTVGVNFGVAASPREESASSGVRRKIARRQRRPHPVDVNGTINPFE